MHKSFIISDRSFISLAKKEVARMAETIGFSEEQKGKIDIIISELTSNLIKHNALMGEILVKQVYQNEVAGIEIMSVDNGPGMRDVKRMMEDGVSTYGSKGEGLGAIKRLSDDFDIYSLFGTGTYILSRLYTKTETVISDIKPRRKKIEAKVVMVPKIGETMCGDEWAIIEQQNNFIVLAADGLGHGKDAHAAAVEASSIFKSCSQCNPAELLKLIHNSIKKTRGIVGGIANINFTEQTLSYCGIGNISGRIFSKDGSKSLISYNGTLGHNIPGTFNNHLFPWGSMNLLILHSDGLKSRWDLAKYPGIEQHDSSLLASVIYKDNTRKTDDALVIVVRS